MSQGKVKWFNDAKGYGFITHEDGRDVFVHYSSIEGEGFRSLTQGQEVEYEAEEGPKGLHASLVRKLPADGGGDGAQLEFAISRRERRALPARGDLAARIARKGEPLLEGEPIVALRLCGVRRPPVTPRDRR